MTLQTARSQMIGSHEVSLEGTDLLHVRCIGEMSARDVEQITAWAQARISQLAGSYMIVDLRKSAGMAKEARRRVADWLRDHHLAAVVNYGASTVSRAFSNLAIRALRALHGYDVENVFVESEDEARAWIARHRAQPRAR